MTINIVANVPSLVVLAAALAQGVAGASAMRQPANIESVVATKMIDVDGVLLRVRTARLESRTPGDPVIVFENGGGMALETWDPILDSVAKLAPIVAYDRSGSGKSAWDSQAPTPERVTARLRRLLATLDVAPPYVLVGHSWGGALVRHFAGASAAEVSAVLYLDPTDITQSPDDEKMIFQSIGADPGALEQFYSFMERSVAKAPPATRAEAAAIIELTRQTVAARKIPPPPQVPTTVILASKPPALPPSGLTFDTMKYADALYRLRLQRLRDWVHAPGEFIVATKAGHFVHQDEPQLVVDALRRLIAAR